MQTEWTTKLMNDESFKRVLSSIILFPVVISIIIYGSILELEILKSYTSNRTKLKTDFMA